jgi:chemotaxis protein CheX
MADTLFEIILKAFTEAAVKTFQKMIMVELSLIQDYDKSKIQFDISGVIGFSGDVKGDCALRMSENTAKEAVTRLTGEIVEQSQEIGDGVGELVNMIAGNAKAALMDFNVSLSFPEIIRGKGHEIGFHRHSDLIELFFTSEIGDICVIVAFSDPEKQ